MRTISLQILAFLFRMASTQATVNKVLVLGGNGLLGAPTVERLISGGNSELTLVSRGNWYWNTVSTIRPFVRHVSCDRTNIKQCSVLKNADWFDVVIDFSCYSGEHMKNVVELLKGKIGRFIYISTDSVYEVCQKNTHGGWSSEEDAVRPPHPQEQEALNRKDSYGDQKLKAEEVLQEQRTHGGFPFISLRLPDVIGPRSNLDRFFSYLLWIRANHIVGPVHLPPSQAQKPMSLVFSEDVAKLIENLINADLDKFNQAYNLACTETITLEDFLIEIAREIGVEDVSFDRSGDNSRFFFPSVTQGPIDINKAKKFLGWEPTPLKEVFKITCEFYQNVLKEPRYESQRRKVIEEMFPDKRSAVEAHFKEKYGHDDKDEL